MKPHDIGRGPSKMSSETHSVIAMRIYCLKCKKERFQLIDRNGITDKAFRIYQKGLVCNECKSGEFLDFRPIYKGYNLESTVNEIMAEHRKELQALKQKQKQKRQPLDDGDPDMKQVPAYKYSKRGQGILHEAIILGGVPQFVAWYGDKGNESIQLLPNIEEATRIIRPPNAEEYPYTPYEFVDRAELNDYFSRANTIHSLGELYYRAKDYFKMYVDQDKNIIVILAADSILTYFQDLFPIIHYTECIGGNDVGKSSIGYTFSYTGYRVVRGTSISGANYTRILGSVEPGQCVIIEDEGDMISEEVLHPLIQIPA